MSNYDVIGFARMAAEGLWLTGFFGFMVFTFYRHFFVLPFNYWHLLEPTHESYSFNRKVLLAFALILLSGLLLFGFFPRS